MAWKNWDVKAERVEKSPRVKITCEIEIQTLDAEDFVKKSVEGDPKFLQVVIDQARSQYRGDQDFLIKNVATAVENRLPKIGTPYS